MSIKDVEALADEASRRLMRLPYSGDDEMKDVFFTGNLITGISSKIKRIDHAIVLFEMSKRREVKGIVAQHAQSDWIWTAVRDVVMSIEDFYKLVTNAKSLMQRCPNIRGVISIREVDKARTLFESYFPDHLAMRNAAGHIVDYSSKPDRTERNSTTEGFTAQGVYIPQGIGFMATESIVNGSIVYTAEGRSMSLPIDRSITSKLISVALEFLRPFQVLNKDG